MRPERRIIGVRHLANCVFEPSVTAATGYEYRIRPTKIQPALLSTIEVDLDTAIPALVRTYQLPTTPETSSTKLATAPVS